MFLVKSFLGNFYRCLAIFSGHTGAHLQSRNWMSFSGPYFINISSLSLSLSLSLTFSALSPFAVTPEPIPFPLTHSTHNLTLWTTCIMRNSIRTSTTNLCCRNHATQCLLYITQIPFLSCHPRYTDFSNSQISVLDLVCDLIVTNWKKHPYKFHWQGS